MYVSVDDMKSTTYTPVTVNKVSAILTTVKGQQGVTVVTGTTFTYGLHWSSTFITTHHQSTITDRGNKL